MSPSESSEVLGLGLVYLATTGLILTGTAVWIALGWRSRGGYGLRGSRGDPSWDWALALPVYASEAELTKEQKSYSLRMVIERLAHAEIETRTCLADGGSAVVVKLRARQERLLRHAARSGYRLELEEVALEERCRRGQRDAVSGEWRWRPLELGYDGRFSRLYPFAHCFVAYDESLHALYRRVDGASILRGVDRARLLFDIVQSPTGAGGAGLAPTGLVRRRVLQASVCLHDFAELRELGHRWRGMSLPATPFRQPLQAVRDYFGEKVGMAFALEASIAAWGIVLACCGLVAWIDVASGDDSRVLPVAAGMAAVAWAAAVARHWKGAEARLALTWGTLDGVPVEHMETRATLIDSPITGKPASYPRAPESSRFGARLRSVAVAATCLCVIVAAVAAEFGLKDCCSPRRGATEYVFASLDALRVEALAPALRWSAHHLALLADRHTRVDHDNTLAAYALVLQFANAIAGLAYVAFLRPFGSSCSFGDDCGRELRVLLAVEFLIRSLFDLGSRAKTTETNELAAVAAGVRDDQSVAFRGLLRTLDRFVLVACFAAAFPLVALLATALDVASLRLEAASLANSLRRPPPDPAADLGAFSGALAAVPVLAAVSNAAILVYTTRYFDTALAANSRAKPALKLLLFLVIEHSAFAAYGLLTLLAPADADVRLQRQRHAFVLSKVKGDVADQDDDGFFGAGDDAARRLVPSAAHLSPLRLPDLTIYGNDEDWLPIPQAGSTRAIW